eukprot:181979-Pelagomonas_calceolata.AAC.1
MTQHFRHADTNLADPKTSAWFMEPLRRVALLGGAKQMLELSAQIYLKLVWAPISLIPLRFHSKVVTGKA